MKTLLKLLFIVILPNLTYAQNQILFFDDFEDEDNTEFNKWTTENIEGWQYWHVIAWNGNPGHCMRFENCDTDQDDWLITKAISCAGAENLKISFSHLFHANKVPPKLYYTSQYNGNAGESVWTELTYTFGDNENKWYPSGDFIIETPGDKIFFAFHYQAKANKGAFFLLDNFSVKSYSPPPPSEKVYSTEHFDFYTNYTDSTDFYKDISEGLEKQFDKMASIWESPQSSVKIYEKRFKVYFSDISEIESVNEETPAWKSGFFDTSSYTIFLSPIDNVAKSSIYQNKNSVAISELSQLFFCLYRNLNYSNQEGNNFIESFGLYESGYRPNRNNINLALDDIGDRKPIINDVRGLDKLLNEKSRDLSVSLIESCILGSGTERLESNFNEKLWQLHLHYFYEVDESLAIRLSKQSDHFNIYCIPGDDNYIEYTDNKLEELYNRFTDIYDLSLKHPTNVVIYPNEATGMEFTNSEWYNGGHAMGKDNYNMLSPNITNNPTDVLDGFLGHEFFHVIHYNLISVNWIPDYKFYMEGLADYMGAENYNPRFAIEFHQAAGTIKAFNNNFQRDPTLDEIMKNTHQENPAIGYINPYFFGAIFYKYLIDNKIANYIELKAFFAESANWNIFKYSYDEIDKGYINFLKRICGFVPPDTLTGIPFKDTFEDIYTGWCIPNYSMNDNWFVSNNGISTGNRCAKFYNYDSNSNGNEAWLISPPLNAENFNEIFVSFDYFRNDASVGLEVFYTNKFNGLINQSKWNSVQKLSATQTIQNTGEMSIKNPADTLFIGIKYSSNGQQHLHSFIDNFNVSGIITNIDQRIKAKNSLSVFPNPATSESIVAFQTFQKCNVSLSVFDLKGREVCTLINDILDIGLHSVRIGNQIKSKGVFVCKLQTVDGLCSTKIVVR